jgi:hypothetical protein
MTRCCHEQGQIGTAALQGRFFVVVLSEDLGIKLPSCGSGMGSMQQRQLMRSRGSANAAYFYLSMADLTTVVLEAQLLPLLVGPCSNGWERVVAAFKQNDLPARWRCAHRSSNDPVHDGDHAHGVWDHATCRFHQQRPDTARLIRLRHRHQMDSENAQPIRDT